MTRFALFAALAGLALPAPACAAGQDCAPAALAAVGRFLHLEHFTPVPTLASDPPGVVVAAACKTRPGEPGGTIVAAIHRSGRGDERGEIVALVDDAGRVASSWTAAIDDDPPVSIGPGSLRIDTAPYDLAPGVRAFGVDVMGGDATCSGEAGGPQRTLFVHEGARLRVVLADLDMAPSRYVRGASPRCASEPEAADDAIVESYPVTIAIGPANAAGWHDLLLSARAVRTDGKGPARPPFRFRLGYAGADYPLDKFRAAFAAWAR